MSLQTFADDVKAAVESLRARIEAAVTTGVLNDLRVEALGKKGALTGLLRGMGELDPAVRPQAGQLVNAAKESIGGILEVRKAALEATELEARLTAESVDITLPGTAPERGRLHPLRQTLNEVLAVLTGMGFEVMTGPEIEDDYHNFEALNFPHDHPARDMQDTFMLPGGLVLRTHTSPVQIRTMLRHKPPIAIVCPGKVYRVDSDVSHSPQFVQIEGLLIDRKTTFADLKGTLRYFVRRIFGAEVDTRFRPSFFPFTEPSAEVDISCLLCGGKGCRYCGHSGWVEVLGSGMVHPNVLSGCDIDPKEYQGFAFGMGIDRICNLKYGIDDIRLLYENDQRFLKQF